MNTPAPALRYPHGENAVLVTRNAHRGDHVAVEEPDGTTTLAQLDAAYGMCPPRTPANFEDPRYWIWSTRLIPIEDPATDHTHPLPGAEVVILRTRMSGGGLAYDAYVPLEQMYIPDDAPYPMMQTCRYDNRNRSSRTFLSFADATMARDVQRMKPGWDRYFACEAHRKASSKHLHRLACTVYPELHQLSDMPFLWVHALVPKVEEVHAERRVPLKPIASAA